MIELSKNGGKFSTKKIRKRLIRPSSYIALLVCSTSFINFDVRALFDQNEGRQMNWMRLFELHVTVWSDRFCHIM